MINAAQTDDFSDIIPQGMTVTIYTRPNGRASEHYITKVRADDAAWFTANSVSVSMEDCGSCFAAYADCGLTEDDDETPREIVVTGSEADGCEALLSNLRLATAAALSA